MLSPSKHEGCGWLLPRPWFASFDKLKMRNVRFGMLRE